jgi:hypothetical protein
MADRFFVLECQEGTGPLHFSLDTDCINGECWIMGRAFTARDPDPDFHPPGGPYELQTELDSKVNERVYPELTWNPLPLMSRRLVNALQQAGVDNFQLYPTRLVNPQGQKPPPEDHYLAVNILGLVAAADRVRSKLNPDVPERMISADFHSLAIDPEKAHDLLLFRLAENVSAVLVHERVKRFVEASGIHTLTWYAPESWAG